MQNPSSALAIVVDELEVETVLWAVCMPQCNSVGAAVVEAIAFCVSRGTATDIELHDHQAHSAAAHLVVCASFIRVLALAHALFALREGRTPAAQELVREATRIDGAVPDTSYPLARAFLSQRVAC